MFKYRAEITKEEEIRYISHLDYAALMGRAICRAKLPASYSEGFNPHLKMAFASALAVGVTSSAEYMDFELEEEMSPLEVAKRLTKALPPCVKVKNLRLMQGKPKALMAEVDTAEYRLKLKLTAGIEEAEKALESFNNKENYVFERITPKKRQEIEVKQFIADKIVVRQGEGGTAELLLTIRVTPTGSIKPAEVISILTRDFAFPCKPDEVLIHRETLMGKGKPLIDLD